MKCDNCQEGAIGLFQVGKQTLPLCKQCHEHFLLREMFDKELSQLMDYITNNQYDDAAAFVDDMMSRFKGRDPLGRVDNQLVGFQAYLLAEQGRLDEALKAHRLLAAMCGGDMAAFLTNQLALAEILDRVGNPQESLNELSRTLEIVPDTEAPVILDLLSKYIRIATREGWAIPNRYRVFIGLISSWYKIQLDKEQLEAGSIQDLVAMIRALIKRT